ncbi:hypothetical protein B0O99DRAFT_625068 [Bisporella sp. PMI_857]|nr:hypothetical protein B0O99DRAFT_625068 [Bisporella sp. PMI_857]
MAYQQTIETETYPRPAVFNLPQKQYASVQGQNTAQNENMPLNAMMNQFAGMNLPTAATAGATGASTQFYVTTDGQFFCAPAAPPAGIYPTQPLAAAPLAHAENTYGYPGINPYLAHAASAYPGYLSGYPMLPYTPGRTGYYTDNKDHLHKEVPGLENRRGSHSTNESTPGTPYYGSISLRDHGTQIAPDRSPFGSTPSPQSLTFPHAGQTTKSLTSQKALHIPINVDIDALLAQAPPIPRAVPAVFTPRESMRTLDQSLSNPTFGNRNVYIRGLHPNTDDDTLAAYAARFGKVETSKAIIDTSTGACKGFGFAKYYDVRDSELCIRGFYKLGYEVGFARESFNSRLKAEGDDESTNLYVSNLPKNMTEAELGAIFMDYKVQSSRILRDSQNNSRGVGFARFETREICEEIIRKFHGQPIGEDGLLLQVRYADTQAQKDLKRITTERRQFRTNEYNVGAYGGSAAEILALSPQLNGGSPLLPRVSQIGRHFPSSGSRASGSWKRDGSNHGSSSSAGAGFRDIDRTITKVSFTDPPVSGKLKEQALPVSPPKTTPTVSEDGSAEDSVKVESPAVAHGDVSSSPSARKSESPSARNA